MTTWTKIAKPSASTWTNLPKPTATSASAVVQAGSPIGLLLAFTYSTSGTVPSNAWINISKASGTTYTNVAKASSSWTKVSKPTSSWTKVPKAT